MAWDPDSGLPTKEGYALRAFVSVRKGGNFGFNWNARQMMGNPTCVELLFDTQRRRIGFRGVPADHPRVRKLSGSWWRGHAALGALNFCRHYDIPIAETRRYTPLVIDGVLVIDL